MNLHFLYLTNTRLVSMSTHGKRIVMRREFAVSGTGAAAFEGYLAGLAGVPVHLFVDLAEEDFRLDTIPHVGARDREAIFARKLTQIFRNTPYRYAEAQGREPDGRRDDRVLYTAITNPEVLRPWLDCIERLKVPLAGIHSAALFSAVMLEELDLLFPHTLLVTFTPGEAMRQSYFRDRELKFSRLTPVDPEASQGLGAMISDETTRTWQYLDSLRHFAADDRLEVCVVLHPDERAKVLPALHDFAQIQHRILDIEQVAAKLGLKPPPLGSTVEEVFVHLFMLRRAPNHFASPELRRYDTLRATRLALYRGSAAVLAASIAWGGWNLAQVMQGGEADQRNAQEMALLNHEYDQITRDLPSFGVGGSTMRDAVGFYNYSIRGFPTVNAFMVALSQVVGEHPEVRLTQVAWEASDDAKGSPSLLAIPARDPPPVKAIVRAEPGAVFVPPQRGEAAFSNGHYEVALVEGTVRVTNNDFRGALEHVKRLAADIGKLDGFSAEVLVSPLDLRPTVALEGRHSEREPATMEPRFVLRVVRAHGPAA